MSRHFSDTAWLHFMYWVKEDRKKAQKISDIIDDIERNGVSKGIGKPEALKHQYQGCWSRKIDEGNRLIYKVRNDGVVYIVSCKGHYN